MEAKAEISAMSRAQKKKLARRVSSSSNSSDDSVDAEVRQAKMKFDIKHNPSLNPNSKSNEKDLDMARLKKEPSALKKTMKEPPLHMAHKPENHLEVEGPNVIRVVP